MEMQDNSVLHVDIGQDSFPRRAKVRPKRSRDSSKSHALTGRDGRVSRPSTPGRGPHPQVPRTQLFQTLVHPLTLSTHPSMSSSHDPVIDPSLRDLPPPTRGMKRKAAAAAKASPAPSAGGRVTRRSAKEQPAPLQPPEPARGEEENLIGYGRNREASTTVSLLMR